MFDRTAMQADDAAEARRYASLALRILAGVWDQSEDPATQTLARRSLERSLCSLRALLKQPELDPSLKLAALVALNSFWDC